MESILESVLRRLRPSEREIMRAREIFEELKKELEPYFRDVNASIQLHGSVEKGTAISGELDLDIFVLIPSELGKEWIRKEFIRRAGKALERYNPEERYAEHPYLRVKFSEGFEADIVPGLRISDPRMSVTAVDRTPFHTELIKKIFDEKMRDEVRLLKRFMKGVGVYGAEVRVGGFSGYLAELLIARFKSFLSVLENASRWRGRVVLSLEESEDPRILKKLFPDAALIYPDPVDPRRNAAAAVRRDTLARFILASKLFLEEPSEYFFYPSSIPPDIIKRVLKERCTIVAELKLLHKDSPDNIWGQLLRIKRRCFNTLNGEGYEPHYIDVLWNERDNPILFVELPLEYCFKDYILRVVEGPYADNEESSNFIRKRIAFGEGFWIREGRLYGYRKRSRKDLMDKIRGLVNTGGVSLNRFVDSEELIKDLGEDYIIQLGEAVLKIPRFLFHKLVV
ncbi:MAG: CCA tRNA nucleotidyltransferase [Sulfolobales archaeon]